ncbi:MAG: T9SS type A sorting domain-containing protein [Lewinellaceae bacterium]|nr:T9SS type A sorting domain-containing protein [Lewinellaceae bacterium]
MPKHYTNSYLKVLLLLFIPAVAFAQTFQCDGTSLPEFYSMYGGSSQFTEHTNDAINTFIGAEEAIAAGDYGTAQNLINDLFATYPKGNNVWWNVFNDPNGANLGTPHAYYGVRMLEDIVNYQLNPASNPVVKTANMKVVLVGCSEGIQPSTNAELQNSTGSFITNELDNRLRENDYCLVKQSLDLFLKYITAISHGELVVNVEYIELPDLCMDVSVTSSPPYFATGSIGPIWDALNDTVKNETDWFWMIYPSHVPAFPDFEDKAFITGGMGSDSKGGPVFIIDDKWLVRKPAHLGSGLYNDIERRIYLPQWLQHEFYHHLFRIYPEFSLEVNGHDWFNLAFWPNDFNGQFEADFYAESLHKRLQTACVPLSNKLITRIEADQVDLSTTLTMNELLGAYSLDNIGNPWHEGEIILDNGMYFWRNSANVQWQVTPNLAAGILETGSDCPYPGQNFKLELYRTPDGELIPGTIGLVFQGELYRKRFDLLREIAPFEITLDTYASECEGTTVDEGTIIKDNGEFYWKANTNEMWLLTLDPDNEAFLLGADSPTPGASFELVVLDEACGLYIPGFYYQNNYYWRPKRNPDRPSPSLTNPLADVALTENFNSQIIDVSMVFTDAAGDPLSLYATSSEPTLLAVNVNGGGLEFSGGTAGNYDICLTAVDENGGVATNAFTVTVGNPVSTLNQSQSALIIYPNPTEDLLYVLKANSTFDVTIYNVNSSIQKSYRNMVNSVSIDLSYLPLGVYFMKIEDPISGVFSVEKIIRK